MIDQRRRLCLLIIILQLIRNMPLVLPQMPFGSCVRRLPFTSSRRRRGPGSHLGGSSGR